MIVQLLDFYHLSISVICDILEIQCVQLLKLQHDETGLLDIRQLNMNIR